MQPPSPNSMPTSSKQPEPERKQDGKAAFNCEKIKAKLYEVKAAIETTEIAFNEN